MKELTFLVGDDAAKDERWKSNFALNLVCDMWNFSNKIREGYVEEDKDKGVIRNTPVADAIRFKIVPTPNEIIEAARTRNYDLVVTDLNYGEGLERAGFWVVEAVKDILTPAQVLALYSSESDPRIKKELVNCGARYVVSPMVMNSSDSKFKLLARTIVGHYEGSAR